MERKKERKNVVFDKMMFSNANSGVGKFIRKEKGS